MKLKLAGRTYTVDSIAHAVEIYCVMRDASGEGARTWPDGRVGKYIITYNGRVWDGMPSHPNTKPVKVP